MFIQANLAEVEKWADVVEQVVDKFGKLNVLLNSAHGTRNEVFEEFYLMHVALPYLKGTKEEISNFTSGARINGKAA